MSLSSPVVSASASGVPEQAQGRENLSALGEKVQTWREAHSRNQLSVSIVLVSQFHLLRSEI